MTYLKSLILAGDIFDSTKPDAKSVEVFRDGLDVMAAAGLPVFVIQGQHDRATPPWPLALVGNSATYVNEKTFQPITNGPVFYAFDQIPVMAVLDSKLLGVPKNVDVLILHQLAKTVFPMEGAYDCDPEKVPDHVKLLLMADYHKKCSFKWHTNKLAYYSGSIHMCKIDEDPKKSVLNLTVGPKGNIVVTDVPLETRSYTFKVINTDEDLKACAAEFAALPKADKNNLPVVVATYTTEVPAVESTLKEALDGKAYLWLRPVSLRAVWTNEGLAADVEAVHSTLESCAGTFLNAETEEYELLMELINNPNIQEVLTKWRTRKQLA